MKNMIKKLGVIAIFVAALSCADDSLDPLHINEVRKGTILALRGTQLNNIYVLGIPGAELFPRIATGNEVFSFDAEFLSDDPTSLESMDIYVIKREGSTRTKVFTKNVSFSAFKQDGTYLRPWVSVDLSFKNDILPKLGIENTFPLTDAAVETLLTTYAFGVNLEVDLNLTDGTKVLASDLVAAGLFGSNQFYPAQKLTYAMTDYCSYDADTWGGSWVGTEVPGSVDANKLVQDPTDPNKYTMDNWWGDGVEAYLIFTPSTNPNTQVVTVPKQTTSEGGIAQGTGTYNQCLGTFSINCTYELDGSTYVFIYNFERP